jgi:hypothetical protein
MVQDVVASVMRMVVGVVAQSPLARAVIFIPPVGIGANGTALTGCAPTTVSAAPRRIPSDRFIFPLQVMRDLR